MSSITEITSDDLTTDACPSFPSEKLKSARDDLDEEENTAEKIRQPPRSEYKFNGKRPKQKTRKYTGSSPIANIINIANCNGVQIGQNYTINMTKKDKKDKLNETVIKTEAICRLLESKECVTRDHILFVSSHVGEGWRGVGRILNYSEGQIYQFEETHSLKGVKEVIYQLLLDWIQNEPQQATLATLADALWNSGQQSVVQMLSEKLDM